jgi:hypothetical protein
MLPLRVTTQQRVALGHEMPRSESLVPEFWGDHFPRPALNMMVPKSPTAQQWVAFEQEMSWSSLVVVEA